MFGLAIFCCEFQVLVTVWLTLKFLDKILIIQNNYTVYSET